MTTTTIEHDEHSETGPALFRTARRATPAVLALALLAGVVLDLGLRAGVANVVGAVGVAVVAVGLLVTGRVPSRHGRVLVALAPAFGVWLLFRVSPWLVPLDVLAAAGLVVLGVALPADGSVLDLSLGRAVRVGSRVVPATVAAPQFLVQGVRVRGDRSPVLPTVRRLLVGALLAVPVVVVVGSLLASADAVFASLFTDIRLGSLTGHVVLVAVGTVLAGAVLLVGSETVRSSAAPTRRWLGPLEACVVLGSLAALYLVFAVTQLVAALGGAGHVLGTRGLTYAENARSGFFQLLAVAGITLLVLLVLRRVTLVEPGRRQRQLTVLSLATVALTLVIVAVTVSRIELYDDVFGLTMLRAFSELFAIWIGLVYVALGLVIVGVGRERHWLLAVSSIAGLVMLLGLNAVNIEGFVARRNLERAATTGSLDAEYVRGLSDDAVPALADGLRDLQVTRPHVADELASELCRRSPSNLRGWAAFNVARDAARRRLGDVCGVG